MQAVLEQELIPNTVIRDQTDTGMKKIGILGTLFGCWHPRLTRPISDKISTYQTCVECGARRQVDAENFKAFGPFYYPTTVSTEHALTA